MALKFGLTPNHLTSDPEDYMAIPQNVQTVDIEQVIERMISRGSTVTKAEALSVIEEYGLALEECILERP